MTLEERLSVWLARCGFDLGTARSMATQAVSAQQDYLDSLQEEDDYDEDDAFEALFLALTEGRSEQETGKIAQILPDLFDLLVEEAEG